MRNCIRAATAVGVLGVSLHALAGPQPGAPQKPPVSKETGKSLLARAVSHFTENAGQWDREALFASRTPGVDFWVTRHGAAFDFNRSNTKSRDGQVVRMSFVGGSKAISAAGANPDGGKFRFFHGRKGDKQTARRFQDVLQQDVYPGIDVRYYVDGDKPRYDFVVEPGADPNKIAVRFDGASKVDVSASKVVLNTKLGQIQNTKLFAFQRVNGKKVAVPASFATRKDGSVGFNLGQYDRSRELVIDPVVYGSFYGGNGGWDEVRSIVADQDGGVYLVGSTQAFLFPALQGPYSFNLNGVQDAFVAKLRGDAYSNVYASFFGGSGSERGEYAQLDPYGNLWVAGRTTSVDFPGNTRSNVQFLKLDQPVGQPTAFPDGGTFLLVHGNDVSSPLPWNATAAQVSAQLNAMPSLAGMIQSVTTVGAGLPRASIRIQLDPTILDAVQVVSTYVGDDEQWPASLGGFEINQGLEARFSLRRTAGGNVIVRHGSTARQWRPGQTPATQAMSVVTAPPTTFTITFNNPNPGNAVNPQTTAALPWNATVAQMVTALNALSNLNGGTFSAGQGILFTPQGATVAAPLDDQFLWAGYSTQSLWPRPVYTVEQPNHLFVSRWARTADGLLDPLPTQNLLFGGDNEVTMNGFAVKQVDNPVQGAPVEFGFAGNTDSTLPEATGTAKGAYIARYRYTTSGGYQKVAVNYLGESAPLLIGGFAMDKDGNGYMTGQIQYSGNHDSPSSAGIFTTLNATWENATKIRFYDVFVRKYTSNNTLLFSGIVGGNDVDYTAGYNSIVSGQIETVGSAIAVDNQNNVYITGITSSFNFPRTPNVVGELFVNNPNCSIFVTKISSDASRFVYSTSLNSSMSVLAGRLTPWVTGIGYMSMPAPIVPAGIAVDFSGNAYITGNCHPQNVSFPDEVPMGMPGAPNQPDATSFPSVPISNAFDGAWDSPGTPEYPTSEGFLTVLNPTAQEIIYSSYVGGRNDDDVYGPYVDRFGDVWVMGRTSTRRAYSMGTSSYDFQGNFPTALMSPLAFKANGDVTTSPATIIFGAYESADRGLGIVQTSPLTVSVNIAWDGFLVKFRLGPPSVATVTFTPGTVPGGLGATSTVLITLSAPAPAGGADITLELDSTNAASFDPNSNVGSVQLTIPAGQSTITRTVYTKPVTTNTGVLVKATYLGSFQVRQLNVVPWLKGAAVTPNTLVGGNLTSGRITLAAPAPAAGIVVNLTSDKPDLVSFPGGGTVTVPAGQDSATYSIETHGVSKKTVASVTASVAGVNQTSLVTLTTANLLNLTFNPPVIPGLGTTTGTIKLDGEAGSSFSVTLSGLPSGYKYPTTLNFKAGEKSKTFTVTVPYEATQTDRSVTVTRAASGGADGYLAGSVSGQFTVSVAAIKGVTVAPNPVEGGDTATGTVELVQPAPVGGVIVKLSTNSTLVTLSDSSITIPEGATTGTFTITTPVLANDTSVVVRAYRDSSVTVKTTLVIKSAVFALTVSPDSVVGGQANATGTVTVLRPAGAGGLTVALSSSDTSVATVPATVTIPSGQTSANFTITTKSQVTNKDVTITATLGSTVQEATLNVRAIGVISIAFDAKSVRGGSVAPLTISLDAPAPAGGLTVSLSSSNALFSNLPPTVFVPAGQTSVRLTSILTKRVSRDQVTMVTASTAGSEASTTLRVTTAF